MDRWKRIAMAEFQPEVGHDIFADATRFQHNRQKPMAIPACTLLSSPRSPIVPA